MPNNCVKKDIDSSFLEENVKRFFEVGIKDLTHEVFYASDISSCNRRILYKVIGSDNDSKEDIKQKFHRKYIVKKWANIFSNINLITIVGSEVVVADNYHNLTDTLDFVIKINDVYAIVMVQERDEKSYSKGVARKHVVHANAQLWLSELQNCFIVYEGKDSKNFSIYHISPSQAIVDFIKEKCVLLNQIKLSGNLPDRKYLKANEDECVFCEFRKRCWDLT